MVAYTVCKRPKRIVLSSFSPKPSGEWTGERDLAIAVGINAVITADNGSATTCSTAESCVSLADGAVRTEAFAVLSSAGSTPVVPPDNPVAVSAVVFSPQVGDAETFQLITCIRSPLPRNNPVL